MRSFWGLVAKNLIELCWQRNVGYIPIIPSLSLSFPPCTSWPQQPKGIWNIENKKPHLLIDRLATIKGPAYSSSTSAVLVALKIPPIWYMSHRKRRLVAIGAIFDDAKDRQSPPHLLPHRNQRSFETCRSSRYMLFWLHLRDLIDRKPLPFQTRQATSTSTVKGTLPFGTDLAIITVPWFTLSAFHCQVHCLSDFDLRNKMTEI